MEISAWGCGSVFAQSRRVEQTLLGKAHFPDFCICINCSPPTLKGENICHSHCNWSPAFPLSSELFLTAVFSLHSFQNGSLPTSSIEARLPPPGKGSHSNSGKPRNPGKIQMLPGGASLQSISPTKPILSFFPFSNIHAHELTLDTVDLAKKKFKDLLY